MHALLVMSPYLRVIQYPRRILLGLLTIQMQARTAQQRSILPNMWAKIAGLSAFVDNVSDTIQQDIALWLDCHLNEPAL